MSSIRTTRSLAQSTEPARGPATQVNPVGSSTPVTAKREHSEQERNKDRHRETAGAQAQQSHSDLPLPSQTISSDEIAQRIVRGLQGQAGVLIDRKL